MWSHRDDEGVKHLTPEGLDKIKQIKVYNEYR